MQIAHCSTFSTSTKHQAHGLEQKQNTLLKGSNKRFLQWALLLASLSSTCNIVFIAENEEEIK